MSRSSRLLRILFVISLGMATSGVIAHHFWRGKTLSVSSVCSKWGDGPIEVQKFKTGNENLRQKMACSILKNQKSYVGKSIKEIRAEFGDPDGFYFSDIYPAYLITPEEDKAREYWQIVFLLNNDRKVTEIIVHKN